MKAVLYFDGSAEPTNPGRATAGAVLQLEDGQQHSFTQYLGQGSNNSAEYGGLILGCIQATNLGVKEIEIYGDSRLVVNCVNGTWKSKQAHLTLHIQQARGLLNYFDEWSLKWIPRDRNIADAYSRCKTLYSHGFILSVDNCSFKESVLL
jgi:ribonuclease HI